MGKSHQAEMVSAHFAAPWVTPLKLGVGQRGMLAHGEELAGAVDKYIRPWPPRQASNVHGSVG